MLYWQFKRGNRNVALLEEVLALIKFCSTRHPLGNPVFVERPLFNMVRLRKGNWWKSTGNRVQDDDEFFQGGD